MSDAAPRMTSYRPYLLRALIEWINDNDMTPHILVDAAVEGVRVPPGVVREGKVVLNIAERAVAGLHMDNQWIGFSARFGGVSQSVSVPVGAVLAVYARETGQGMVLPEEVAGTPATAETPVAATPVASAGPGSDSPDGPESPPDGPAHPGSGKRPHLRVVK